MKLLVGILILFSQVSLSQAKYKSVDKKKLKLVYNSGMKEGKEIYEDKNFLYSFKGNKLIEKQSFKNFSTIWLKEMYRSTGEFFTLKDNMEKGNYPSFCKSRDMVNCFERFISSKKGEIGLNEGMLYMSLGVNAVFKKKEKMGKMDDKKGVYSVLELMRLNHLVLSNIENPKKTVRRTLKKYKLRSRYTSDPAYKDEVRLTTGIQFTVADEFLTKSEKATEKIANQIKSKLKVFSKKEQKEILDKIETYSKLDRERIMQGNRGYEALIEQYELENQAKSN